MKQNVQHKDIPFDQLGTFKSPNDEYYQNQWLALLLTTLATFHLNKKKNHKSATFITTKTIWISDKRCWEKPGVLIGVRKIQGIVKSYKNPQLTIITTNDQDNIRVTTTTEQRCWYIISAISYIFTEVYKKKLPFISINSNLHYFQRTALDKTKGSNININSNTYSSLTQMINYQKPYKKIPNIFGFIKQCNKIILDKQLQSISYANINHEIYLARIKQQSYQNDIKNNIKNTKNKNQIINNYQDNLIDNNNKQVQIICEQDQQQDRYICHYIKNEKQYLQQLSQHKNLQFITKIIFAKNLQYKIQIFFQYSKPLIGIKINQIIFQQIWQLYDKVKFIDSNAVITTQSLLVVEKNKIIGRKIKRPQPKSLIEEQQRWKKGEYITTMMEFRYKFLNETVQWDRFLYEVSIQVLHEADTGLKEQVDEQDREQLLFSAKLFNIGLILYELVTGKHLLLYSPVFTNPQQVISEQVRIINELKKQIIYRQLSFEIFPKFLNLKINEKLKNFIESCIFRKFQHYQDLVNHPWIHWNNRKISQSSVLSDNGWSNGNGIGF